MRFPFLRKLLAAGLATSSLAALALIAPSPASAESLGRGRQVVGSAPSSGSSRSSSATGTPGRMAKLLYGTPRSGMLWHTGFWTGSGMSATRTIQAEAWAGRPYDFVTVYPAYGSWQDLADSGWVPHLLQGYRGRLAYGLPLLPNNRRGQWNDILSGQRDDVFRKIARELREGGFGDAAIRVGLEANGDWFAWGATAATAPQFRAAFRRVVSIMNRESPELTFWFDTSAGYGLRGQTNRLDAFNLLYPGDHYVDGISMDHYDFYELRATNSATWAKAIRPTKGPGLADAAEFARARKKGFAVPEWGLHNGAGIGGGDNPYFIQKMHEFFRANSDVLVFECYFNEPDPYIRNALFSPVQLPKGSAAYLKLF